MSRKVALLGGGKMAEALLSGLIRSGGRSVDEIMVTNRREERARELAGKYGITATLDNAEAVRWADVLVLMAKPQDTEMLLSQIRENVTAADLVITFRRRGPDLVRSEAPARRRARGAGHVQRAGDGRRGHVRYQRRLPRHR